MIDEYRSILFNIVELPTVFEPITSIDKGGFPYTGDYCSTHPSPIFQKKVESYFLLVFNAYFQLD